MVLFYQSVHVSSDPYCVIHSLLSHYFKSIMIDNFNTLIALHITHTLSTTNYAQTRIQIFLPAQQESLVTIQPWRQFVSYYRQSSLLSQIVFIVALKRLKENVQVIRLYLLDNRSNFCFDVRRVQWFVVLLTGVLTEIDDTNKSCA